MRSILIAATAAAALALSGCGGGDTPQPEPQTGTNLPPVPVSEPIPGKSITVTDCAVDAAISGATPIGHAHLVIATDENRQLVYRVTLTVRDGAGAELGTITGIYQNVKPGDQIDDVPRGPMKVGAPAGPASCVVSKAVQSSS
jgi:hypothetical protein